MLDSEGKTLEGWPLQMGDIQAQVAVGDINGDGQLELISGDKRGNVAAFTAKAEELWERHVGSEVSQVPANLLPFAMLRYGMSICCLGLPVLLCIQCWCSASGTGLYSAKPHEQYLGATARTFADHACFRAGVHYLRLPVLMDHQQASYCRAQVLQKLPTCRPFDLLT